MITVKQAKQKMTFWGQQFTDYENRAKLNGGKLKRYEMWQREYCETPYLTLAGEEYLSRRMVQQYHNNVRLTKDGGIVPRPDFGHDQGLFGPLFTHLMLEYQCRGGVPDKVVKSMTGEMNRYYAAGDPVGVKLLRSYPENLSDVIVKYGKKEHLRSMFLDGEIRISPASYYSDKTLLMAMVDSETRREFHVPALKEYLAGRSYVYSQGLKKEIIDGFVKMFVECPNYMLWCACLDIDRRMPTDFNADAALVVRDCGKFVARITSAVQATWPTAGISTDKIEYYDPCSFVAISKNPAFIKHFEYAYQREWRFCVFLKDGEIPSDPVAIKIGSLEDISELVTLPA